MKKRVVLFLNLLLVITEIIGIYLCVSEIGFTLEYFTENSNMFCLVISIIYVFYILLDKKIPNWLKLCKYTVVTSLTLTFLVVVFVLVPTMKEAGGLFNLLFSGSMLYHHTICPIICFISYVFFEKWNIKGWKNSMFAISFAILYAVIATILNITKTMYGPYPFLHVYEQSIYISFIWFVSMIGGAYIISYLIGKVCHFFNR